MLLQTLMTSVLQKYLALLSLPSVENRLFIRCLLGLGLRAWCFQTLTPTLWFAGCQAG
jgi:hypothetical protein